MFVGMAVAAALFLTTLGALIGMRGSGPNPELPASQPIAKDKPKADPRSSEPAPVSVRDSVEEARLAVAGLGDDLAARTRLWWTATTPLSATPMLPMPSVGDIEQPLNPAAQSVRETGNSVSVSLQTVADSARRAADYFLRELPALDYGGKTGL
jgi:hypothetical protein